MGILSPAFARQRQAYWIETHPSEAEIRMRYEEAQKQAGTYVPPPIKASSTPTSEWGAKRAYSRSVTEELSKPSSTKMVYTTARAKLEYVPQATAEEYRKRRPATTAPRTTAIIEPRPLTVTERIAQSQGPEYAKRTAPVPMAQQLRSGLPTPGGQPAPYTKYEFSPQAAVTYIGGKQYTSAPYKPLSWTFGEKVRTAYTKYEPFALGKRGVEYAYAKLPKKKATIPIRFALGVTKEAISISESAYKPTETAFSTAMAGYFAITKPKQFGATIKQQVVTAAKTRPYFFAGQVTTEAAVMIAAGARSPYSGAKAGLKSELSRLSPAQLAKYESFMETVARIERGAPEIKVKPLVEGLKGIERLPGKSPNVLASWLKQERGQVTLGGSVAQRLQLKRGPIPSDVDIYVRGILTPGEAAQSLAAKLKAAGIKRVSAVVSKRGQAMEKGQVTIAGQKAVEFHSESWLLTNIGAVKKPFSLMSGQFQRTPEGVKILGIYPQLRRKLVGGLVERGRPKDIAHYRRIVSELSAQIKKQQTQFGTRSFFGKKGQLKLLPDLGAAELELPSVTKPKAVTEAKVSTRAPTYKYYPVTSVTKPIPYIPAVSYKPPKIVSTYSYRSPSAKSTAYGGIVPPIQYKPPIVSYKGAPRTVTPYKAGVPSVSQYFKVPRTSTYLARTYKPATTSRTSYIPYERVYGSARTPTIKLWERKERISVSRPVQQKRKRRPFQYTPEARTAVFGIRGKGGKAGERAGLGFRPIRRVHVTRRLI